MNRISRVPVAGPVPGLRGEAPVGSKSSDSDVAGVKLDDWLGTCHLPVPLRDLKNLRLASNGLRDAVRYPLIGHNVEVPGGELAQALQAWPAATAVKILGSFDLKNLCQVPVPAGVKELHLDNCGFEVRGLDGLFQRFPGVTSLAVSNSGINFQSDFEGPDFSKAMGDLKKSGLKCLDISNVENLNDRVFLGLPDHMGSLVSICLGSGLSLTSKSLRHLFKKFPNLVSIDLRDLPGFDSKCTEGWPERLPCVKNLVVRADNFSGSKALSLLERLPGLERLVLSKFHDGSEDSSSQVDFVHSQPHVLRELDLSGMTRIHGTMQWIIRGGTENLRILRLDGSLRLDDALLRNVVEHNLSLTHLSLNGCLNIEGGCFFSSGRAPVAENDSEVSDSRIRSLIELDLGGCSKLLDGVAPGVLKTFPKLKVLRLSGIESLAQKLRHDPGALSVIYNTLAPVMNSLSRFMRRGNLQGPRSDTYPLEELDVSSSRGFVADDLDWLVKRCPDLKTIHATGCDESVQKGLKKAYPNLEIKT